MLHELGHTSSLRPISVNWTITTSCNYRCKFCFARFPELTGRDPLPHREMLQIPQLLAEAGCEKLTFVGGEPLLCPILPSLLEVSHDLGLTTMIVTNGSLLTHGFHKQSHENIDWVSLSIDSQYEHVQQQLGRGIGNHVSQTIRNVQLLRAFDIRLKLNSVITRRNFEEEMCDFIESMNPERWKAFQALSVNGQNDHTVKDLLISSGEYALFRRNHQRLQCAVFEDNQAMQGSYLMLSPFGEFFSNASGRHVYGPSILDVGVDQGLRLNAWDVQKFVDRGGIYSWA
jgi:radical S-adenosyl methionine domain-containing protein 2